MLFNWPAIRSPEPASIRSSSAKATEDTILRPKPLTQFRAKDGGADRNRTCDLLIANETLCQLSYDPIHSSRGSFAKKSVSRNR
jgi:hypothetical protein